MVEYHFDTQTWTRKICLDMQPTTRTFHQSAIFDGYLFVFGGFDGMKRNDMYRAKVEITDGPGMVKPVEHARHEQAEEVIDTQQHIMFEEDEQSLTS